MHEAIDYNALSWVRQELGETLKQASLKIEAYANSKGNTALLHGCAALLHEARGPLQMVGLKGADRLATEIEEVLTDLLQGAFEVEDPALEILMQAFLQLQEYLSNIRSSRQEIPAVLLPVINELRASRGIQPLQERAFFSANLSARVPESVFSQRTAPADIDPQEMARSARLKFQSGLLEWYRGGKGNTGLQALLDVLDSLLQCAGSEPAARVWWVAAGLVDVLIAGELSESQGSKQLFGQLDRQIKRLLDSGESVFADAMTDELLSSMLFEISRVGACSSRVDAINATYGLKNQVPSQGHGQNRESCLSGVDSELLQTVSVTLVADIGRIREQLDEYAGSGEPDAAQLVAVAGALHALGNTLDMVGLGHVCAELAAREHQLLAVADPAGEVDALDLGELVATLVAVEDAVQGLATGVPVHARQDTETGITFSHGLEAVARAVLADIALAKEAINEFTAVPAQRAALAGVQHVLNRASSSLQRAGQERAAAVAGSIGRFVAQQVAATGTADCWLEPLAEALCSVEYYVEGWLEDENHGEAALGLAEQCVDTLSSMLADAARVVVDDTQVAVLEDTAAAGIKVSAPDGSDPVVTGLQVIAEDADEEIVAIFIEEAGDALAALHTHIPVLLDSPGDLDALSATQRAFHTLKGSGRMLGAMALGEFAWRFENLVSRVIQGVLQLDTRRGELLAAAPAALELLLGQVNGVVLAADSWIDELARQAAMLSEPGAAGPEQTDMPSDVADAGEQATNESPHGSAALPELPVLSAEADEEIVEIFLEEAAEQAASIAQTLPVWLGNPEDGAALAAVRSSFHTLKGSGRMAGAMLIGEFAWAVEDLLNRLIEGSIEFSASLAALLELCGEALSQLNAQLQDGTAPTVNIPELMAAAAVLARGEDAAPAAVAAGAVDETGADEFAAADTGNEELSLLEVFSNESRDHVAAINAFLDAGDEPCMVTEALYRALHTLSGITESAEIHTIQGLAGDLNVYFDALYNVHQPVCSEALDVLRDAAAEIDRMVARLPDLSLDEQAMMELRDRIAALPPVAATAEHDLSGAGADVDAADTGRHAGITLAVDSDTGIDEELLEIFIEESAELVDASESVLRCWSEDPGNRELRSELQRQLHTLKGGARMVGIPAIGDLSHALESLLALVADGAVVVSENMFAVLHASQDRLAEMLERVKAHQLPEAACDLQQELEMLAAGEVTGEHEAGATAETCTATATETGTETTVHTATDTTEACASDAGEDAAVDSLAAPGADQDGGAAPPSTAADRDCALNNTGHEIVSGPEVTVVRPAAVQPVSENAAQLAERRRPARARSEQVRVQSGLLDDMVNHAGEINIYRTRMEQQISDYRFNLAELDQTISRLREQLRQLEMETEIQILFRHGQEEGADRKDFDPLEMDRYSNLQQLSRSLMESISDLRSLQELMEVTTRESETLLLQQSRVSTDLQEGLMHTRMIPFAGLASRLRRIVRQTARQLGKKAELVLQGGDGEIDRTVIDRIVAPLEHMLRNAVAHGIESPKARNKSGKAETGNITVAFERDGPEIVLRVADDGAGMNIDAIRARAIEHGMMTEDARLNDVEIMQFILQTGFSTASDVTQISGRGVGLDVVNAEVKQLGGSLYIDSTVGKGSVFTLRLPYTLAINQVLLVKAGGQDFCVPLGSIEGVVRVMPGELEACYAAGECLYEYGGNQYQLKHLGSVLGTGGLSLDLQQERVPVLLARVGERRVALQVEALLGSREIVIKPVGVQLSSVGGISGATILGDGRVVLILDMAAVARMTVRTELPTSSAAAQDESRLVIMVVDDSITVRKVTTRLLERNGFKVLTAKDGVDAVGQLQHGVPDMMLLDIEMPRMDGFELATHMRNDEQLRHVPIIMITSRTGDKHRQRAQAIGVDNYLGKPYQENDLLESIHRIIGIQATAG